MKKEQNNALDKTFGYQFCFISFIIWILHCGYRDLDEAFSFPESRCIYIVTF